MVAYVGMFAKDVELLLVKLARKTVENAVKDLLSLNINTETHDSYGVIELCEGTAVLELDNVGVRNKRIGITSAEERGWCGTAGRLGGPEGEWKEGEEDRKMHRVRQALDDVRYFDELDNLTTSSVLDTA